MPPCHEDGPGQAAVGGGRSHVVPARGIVPGVRSRTGWPGVVQLCRGRIESGAHAIPRDIAWPDWVGRARASPGPLATVHVPRWAESYINSGGASAGECPLSPPTTSTLPSGSSVALMLPLACGASACSESRSRSLTQGRYSSAESNECVVVPGIDLPPTTSYFARRAAGWPRVGRRLDVANLSPREVHVPPCPGRYSWDEEPIATR
jgi:hypothetical protein